MDPTLIAIHALVACLLLAGLAGSVLPFLPGTPLIFLGALVHALATDFSPTASRRVSAPWSGWCSAYPPNS